jgi:hypothetical protein
MYRAGYPPVVLGAPRPIAHAAVTLEIAVNVAPKLVEWKRPLSVDTQRSPEVLRFTTILTGAVELPREPVVAVKVTPLLVEI